MSIKFNKKTISIFYVFLSLLLISCLTLYVNAASSGPRNPSVGADDSATGTIAWTNPSNATSSDNIYATVTLSNVGDKSHYLKVTGFNFSIPAGATINGITATIERKGANANKFRDNSVKIIKCGSIVGTEMATSTSYPTTDTSVTYGSSTNLWGQTWTPSDINNANFGLALSSTRHSSGSGSTVSVDNITITVTYTTNTAPNAPTLVSPLSGSYTNNNKPTLSANYSDPDTGDTGTTNYKIATSSSNCLNDGTVATGTSAETSINNQNTTWTPVTSIGSDGTYYWCAQNNDGFATSSWTSMGNFILDTVSPTISISAPSATSTNSGPVTYTITYGGADSVSLVSGNITLNKTGSATGTVSVTGPGTTTRIVTISSINGNGTLGISIASNTASDNAGNNAPSAGPSTAFNVTNIFTLSYNAGLHGSITGSTTQIVNYGGSGTQVTAVADPGYHFTSWSDGATTTSRTDTNVTSNLSVTANFASSAIVPTKFVIVSANNGTIDLPSLVTVEAQNASGTLADTYEQDVTLVTTGSAVGGGLINIVNGVGTTSISDSIVESINLSLLDSEGTGLNASSTMDISFSAGNTSKLSIIASSTSMIAGNRLPVTILRQDRLGNAVTLGSENFYLYKNSAKPVNNFYNTEVGGSIINTILIPNGSSSAIVWFYDESVGSPSINISDNSSLPDGNSGIDDDSISIIVSSAQPSALYLNNPGDLTAGEHLHYEVSRKDQFGNYSDNGTTTIYLYEDSTSTSTKFYNLAIGGSQISYITMSPGISTSSFWLYGEKAESFNITVSDSFPSPDGNNGIIDISDSLTINPASVGKFYLNNPGNMTIGTRLGYIVSRLDLFSNYVTSGSSTVYLYHDVPASSTVFYNSLGGMDVINSLIIGNGSSANNFWFYSENIGNYNITASDNSSTPDSSGVIDTTDSVNISPVPIVATRFVIANTSTTTVGVTAPITVEAKDDFGDRDTTYNGSVLLHTSGNSSPGGIVNIVSGIGSVNIIDTKAETVNLTLENVGSTTLDVSSTRNITFVAGPTNKFIMSGTSNTLAGNRGSYSIVRKDQYDNLVTEGADVVYLYSNAPSGSANFYNSSSGGSQILFGSILNGSNSTDVWFEGKTAGTWKLYASDNATSTDGSIGIIDGSSVLSISPNITARLFINDPGDMMAGTRLGYTATRFDAYNNLVTSGSEDYYLYSNAISTSTAFYKTAIGGSPITKINFVNGDSSSDFYYKENALGVWTVYLSDNSVHHDGSTGIIDGEDGVTVSPVPIVATKFIITVSSNDVFVGTPVTVNIKAVDGDGNVDTTYQNDVTLHVSGGASGGGLIYIINGVGEIVINDTIGETVNLTLEDTENTHLDISSSQSIVFNKVSTTVSKGGRQITTLISPTVSFTGKAFPFANFQIVAIQGGNIPVNNLSKGSMDGNFNTNYSGVLPSTANSFALVVYDENNNISQTKVFKLGVNDQLAKDILMAPTVNLKAQSVMKGAFLGIIGKAMPSYKIQLMVDGLKSSETTTADKDGNYDLNFNTYRLVIGEHKLKVRQIDDSGKTSDYSIEKNFQITKNYISKADLNNDGIVDIKDLSIFISKYKSGEENVRQSVDLNGDSKVDTTDISLFMEALSY